MESTTPFLEVLGGPDHGRRLALDRRDTVVGRAPESDLRIDDPTRGVSGRHAVIRRRKEGWELHDESRNGTFWRPGRKGAPTRVEGAGHALRDGQVIVLSGEIELLFRDPTARPEPSPERGRLLAGLGVLVLLLGGLLVVVEGGRDDGARTQEAALRSLFADLPLGPEEQRGLEEAARAASWSERRGDAAGARERWAHVLMTCREHALLESPLAEHARRRLSTLAD